MTKIALALAVGILALSGTVHGYEEWNVNATSCVADAGSIQNNLYIGTGGTVKFASGKTGDIILYCHVPNLTFVPTTFGITYYDDTPARGNHVTAQLIKMDMFTGLITRIVTIDSDNGFVSTGGNANTVGHEFVDSYDPKNFAYYIRIDIVRNSTVANETLYAVGLLN